jgi:hypothetical protein
MAFVTEAPYDLTFLLLFCSMLIVSPSIQSKHLIETISALL